TAAPWPRGTTPRKGRTGRGPSMRGQAPSCMRGPEGRRGPKVPGMVTTLAARHSVWRAARMRTTVLLPLLLVFAASGLYGQDNTRTNRDVIRRSTVRGGLEIGIPLGEFDDTCGRQTAGFSVNMALPMRRLPLHW